MEDNLKEGRRLSGNDRGTYRGWDWEKGISTLKIEADFNKFSLFIQESAVIEFWIINLDLRIGSILLEVFGNYNPLSAY